MAKKMFQTNILIVEMSRFIQKYGGNNLSSKAFLSIKNFIFNFSRFCQEKTQNRSC